MTEKHLHIVTHDVPWPADYGGVMDLFYKLTALHKLGVKIHLHCFTQGRLPQEELKKYCVEVIYYKREKHAGSLSFRMPFIVNSRKNDGLIHNLQKDNHPVLLEGIHCTYYLQKGFLQNRKIIVRLHNVEFEYYSQLAKNESNIIRKLYFFFESRLLRSYEKALANKAIFLAVSEQDTRVYRELFGARDIHFLPVFIPYSNAAGKPGMGTYCLYHGNLSINENEKAVMWLLHNVFNNTAIPFVIAGKNPSKKLLKAAHRQNNTCLIADPNTSEMQDLICKAQINILPSFNNTGIKLKLMNALFNGRHCIVNKKGVEGSGLEPACYIEETAEDFRKCVKMLFHFSFDEKEIETRNGLLQKFYNNQENAKQLVELI